MSKVKVAIDKKTAFIGFLAACMWFIFGKTSLASSFEICLKVVKVVKSLAGGHSYVSEFSAEGGAGTVHSTKSNSLSDDHNVHADR